MRIVSLASEAAPFVKTGGLGDVAGALPAELSARGHEVHLVLPLYARIDRARHGVHPAGFEVEALVGGRTYRLPVWTASASGATAWFLEHPVFDRDGLYGPQGGGDYGDNHWRFALWTRGALSLTRRVCPSPDVLHLHDWQAGLAAVDIRALGYAGFDRTRIVFTIHNLGYIGAMEPSALADIDLPDSLYTPRGLEFYGRASLMKGGLVWADILTTVSPRYAQEIRTPAFGEGFEGLLQSRASSLTGVLNGIDDKAWNPETDPHLAAHYSAFDLRGKQLCKQALQQEMGLHEDREALLFGVVSRLASQKGIDLVAELVDTLVAHGAQIAVVGSGDPALEHRLTEAARRHPGRVAARIGFHDALAHRIVAGSDALLVPSRYEPCGLTQMYAMRYGTIPVVRAVGGLDDTVDELDAARSIGTGFKFGAPTGSAFWAVLQRALGVWQQPHVWAGMQRRGMSLDWSWEASVSAYERLYEGL